MLNILFLFNYLVLTSAESKEMRRITSKRLSFAMRLRVTQILLKLNPFFFSTTQLGSPDKGGIRILDFFFFFFLRISLSFH